MTNIKSTEKKAVTIEVGTPVTYCIGADRYDGKITAHTASKKTLTVTFVGDVQKYTLRKCGRYREVGSDAGYLQIGVAEDRRDPSF